MVKADEEGESDGLAYTTSDGARFPFVTGFYFQQDDKLGHGTHMAGTVAGATVDTPARTVKCEEQKVLGCVGVCMLDTTQELNSTNAADLSRIEPDDGEDAIDLNRLCPMFDCDGQDDELCLGDDVAETLADHGGIAQGAKLAIFDIFFGNYSYGDFAGNGLWEVCLEAGCKVHSNSYGADTRCELTAVDILYDDFMYKVSGICYFERPIVGTIGCPRSHFSTF